MGWLQLCSSLFPHLLNGRGLLSAECLSSFSQALGMGDHALAWMGQNQGSVETSSGNWGDAKPAESRYSWHSQGDPRQMPMFGIFGGVNFQWAAVVDWASIRLWLIRASGPRVDLWTSPCPSATSRRHTESQLHAVCKQLQKRGAEIRSAF